MDWKFAFGVVNAVLIINMCVAYNMRVRKLAGHFLVAYASLFLYGYLTLGSSHTDTISSHVVSAITMFTTGTLAVLLELFTGAPSCTSIIPVVLILAPGSTAVRISLEDMQYSGRVADAVLQQGIWDNLILLCVSFAVGLFMSLELLKSTLKYKHTLRSAVENLSPRLTNSNFAQQAEDPTSQQRKTVSVNMGNVAVL